MTRQQILAAFAAGLITLTTFYHLCCDLEYQKHPHPTNIR